MDAPPEAIIIAWTALLRAQAVAVGAVERAMKAARLPGLEWYDVLRELEEGGPMRPRDLQARLSIAQYTLSRLLERMAAAGVIARAQCPEDQRGLIVSITPPGAWLRQRMGRSYGPAIAAAIGGRLDAAEAAQLTALLNKLIGDSAPPA